MIAPLTSVLVIAQTPALRAGLEALLAASDLETTGLLADVTFPQIDQLNADIIVIGDHQVLESLEDRPGTVLPPLVVLTDDPQTIDIVRRLPTQSWAILSWHVAASELQAAVRAVVSGLIVLHPAYLPPPAAVHIQAATTTDQPDEPLTGREQEVLQLLGEGLSNKQIARRLTISEHTVKFHVSAVFGKLGAVSRADAVSRGARRGLLTL
ncbi:MAG: response regulator transcription factor [Herpetosiphon sp.]